MALLFAAGCGEKKTSSLKNNVLSARTSFAQGDFNLSTPKGWTYQDKESTKDAFTYKSPDGKSQLVITVAQLDKSMPKEEKAKFFKAFVENRRKMETDAKPSPVLSDTVVGTGEGFIYAKYAGIEKTQDRCYATLITAEKGKLFTLCVQRTGVDKEALTALSNDIFSNFNVK